MTRYLFIILLITQSLQSLSALPRLILREDWAQIPFALPITPDHLDNPALELNLYGAAVDALKKSHHDNIENDPYYVWSGEIRTSDPWGATLSFKDKASFDLSGEAFIRWRTRQSGAHHLNILLRTLGGKWLVSENLDPASSDWQVHEHVLSTLAWSELSADRIDFANATPQAEPDMNRIVEVGFTDLLASDGSAQSSRLDWIEVHGFPRPKRSAVAKTLSNDRTYAFSSALSNDGNLGTHWMAKGNNRTLTAELLNDFLINGLEIAWWKSTERTTGFKVEVSTNNSEWTEVIAPRSSLGIDRDFEYYPLNQPAQGRYVRITGSGNTANEWNSITEWKILGEPLAGDWFDSYRELDGWRNVVWFGYVKTADHPWIEHANMGRIFMNKQLDGSVYLWDKDLGWMITSESTFPYLYFVESQTWAAFVKEPLNRIFYDLNKSMWMQH
jgi:hypothetical protein